MTTTPTPAPISEERLRELDKHYSRYLGPDYDGVTEANLVRNQDCGLAIRELLSRRSQAQPVDDRYWQFRQIAERANDRLKSLLATLAQNANDTESEILSAMQRHSTPTAPAPQGSPVAAEPSWDALIEAADAFKLPVDVKIGAGTFRKGVKVGTAIRCLKNHAGYPSEIPDSEYPTLGVWSPDIASPAPQGEKCSGTLRRDIAGLQEVLEYLEDREDVVDGSYGEPHPNKEMSLAQMLRSIIKRLEASCNGTGQQPAEAVGEAGEVHRG